MQNDALLSSKSGLLPNIYYNSVSHSTLRSHAGFRALPPVESLCISCAADYENIRQDDPLWSRLHTGRLTTGLLPASLGLLGPHIGSTCRLPNHKHLQDAYTHLIEPEYVPDLKSVSVENANTHNTRLIESFNQDLKNKNTDDVVQDSIPIEKRISKSEAAGGRGVLRLRCAWGKAQEAATLFTLINIFPDSTISEVGLCVPPSSAIRKDANNNDIVLPPCGASPDAMILHSSVIPKTKNQYKEIVEVKNTCPFMYGREGSKGRRLSYMLNDNGPRQSVDPLWMPQLQFHMFCANTESGLLVSRSATRGMRIFRVYRDEEYLNAILFIISTLYDCVKQRKRPRRNCLSKLKQFEYLVKRSREIAIKAEIIEYITPGDERLSIPPSFLESHVDQHLFLDAFE